MKHLVQRFGMDGSHLLISKFLLLINVMEANFKITKVFFVIYIVLIALSACTTDSEPVLPEQPDYTLTIEITPEGAGTTNPLPGGFDEGANLELEAIPAENYLFDRWAGDLTTESNPADLTMNSNKVITAVFKRAPLTMGGDGSQANPYQVHSLDDLIAIGLEENLDKHFIQTADIDASASEELQNGSGFKFIGDAEHPFAGSYDGNGYSIMNLKINFNKFDPHNGMFGYTKDALLQNITIDNREQLVKADTGTAALTRKETPSLSEIPDVQNNDIADMEGVGGLAGMNDGGLVQNCHFIGSITLPSGGAGLVGINTGTIEKSSFEGYISGTIFTASGLVTYNSGSILSSEVKGEIDGQGASGFVSDNFGQIYESNADVNIAGSIAAAGFIINNEGMIRSSVLRGKINGYRYSNGFVGNNKGLIEDVYVIADHQIELYEDDQPDIKSDLGGFAGRNDSEGVIRNAFTAGSISVDGNMEELSLFGAFAGENLGSIDHGYWDKGSTGIETGVDQGNPEGATGLSTAQMTGTAAEQNMPEFDWVNIWRINEDGYPVLRWEEE